MCFSFYYSWRYILRFLRVIWRILFGDYNFFLIYLSLWFLIILGFSFIQLLWSLMIFDVWWIFYRSNCNEFSIKNIYTMSETLLPSILFIRQKSHNVLSVYLSYHLISYLLGFYFYKRPHVVHILLVHCFVVLPLWCLHIFNVLFAESHIQRYDVTFLPIQTSNTSPQRRQHLC